MIYFNYIPKNIERKCNTKRNEKLVKNFINNLDKNEAGDILELPELDISEIEENAKILRDRFDSMLIVGCGANSLPLQCFYNTLYHDKELIFINNMLDNKSKEELFNTLKDKNYCINVITRSGNTGEVLEMLNILESMAIKDIIFTVGSKVDRKLVKHIKDRDYDIMVVDSNCSGRFSTFTTYTLLPLAFAGVKIDELLLGAKTLFTDIPLSSNIMSASPFAFALIQKELSKHKSIEILSTFNSDLFKLFKWYEQLFMESLSKQNKGIYYSNAYYPRDLHYKEQYLEQGKKNIYEIMLLNTDDITSTRLRLGTEQAVAQAHKERGIPLFIVSIDALTPFVLGQIIMYFQIVCMFRAYLEKIDCFNQPGVEKYKSLTATYQHKLN